MFTPIWQQTSNKTFLSYISEESLLTKQPADLKLHHGFLKEDVFCLKLTGGTEAAKFVLEEIFERRVSFHVFEHLCSKTWQ